MSKIRDKYVVFGVDLYDVRNRNEQRIAKSMIEAITKERLENKLNSSDIRDIYAYALNQLEARYAQSGTIILRDPVRKEKIDKAVAEAITLVMNHPKDKG